MERLERIFKSVLQNPNFVTPNVVDYFQKGIYVIELSYDYSDFFGYAFGVTVVDSIMMKNCEELGKCFFGRNPDVVKKEAMEYIADLS